MKRLLRTAHPLPLPTFGDCRRLRMLDDLKRAAQKFEETTEPCHFVEVHEMVGQCPIGVQSCPSIC